MGVDRELLERDREVGALEAAIDRASAGQGSVVVLEGPAGIGKTALVEAAIRAADERGLVTLTARASPLESDFAFGTILDLLGPAVGQDEANVPGELFEGAAGAARPLFAIGEDDPRLPAEIDASQATIHGIYWLVSNLAERSPLLLAIDDAHWADEASQGLIHHLGRRVESLPLALAVGVRSGEPGGESQALLELRSAPKTTILTPQPLSADGVADLVGRSLSAPESAFCDACAEATAGNPLYLKELLGSLSADGVEPTGEGARAVARLGPLAVRRVVLLRLGRMSDAQRALARAAAVAGDGAALRHAATIAGLSLEEASVTADALVDSDILERHEPIAFRHPILREAIYSEIGEAERARAHLEAALSLAGEGAQDEEVAAHLMPAARGAERWVVDVLCRAAERAANRGSPRSARRYLERALEESGGLERRGEALFALGMAEAMLGEARGPARIAEAASAIDDPEQRAVALMHLGRILGVRGRFGESASVFVEAAGTLEGTGSELAWWADAGGALSATHHLPARAWALERLEVLLERDGLETLPVGRSVLAFGAIERTYAARPATEALKLARRVTRTQPDDVQQDGVAHRMAAMSLAICGEVEEADSVTAAVEAQAREQGSAAELGAASYVRMLIALNRGDVSALLDHSMATIEALRFGWGIGVPSAHSLLAAAHLERGELDEAERALDLEGGEARWRDDFQFPFWLEGRGSLSLARANPARALEDFEQAGSELEKRGIHNPALSHAPWRCGAALALARLGDRERALELAEAQLGLARRFGSERAIGAALRCLGLVSEDEQGIAMLEEAVTHHELSGSTLELSLSSCELGAALRRQGRRRECRDPLRRALDLAQRAGALATATRAETELKASGARPRSVVLTGIEALTPSERRIASLVAQGLTNRQVAEQLYLTRKTVESHLRGVYRKLDIGSRDELPAALAAEDDQPSRE